MTNEAKPKVEKPKKVGMTGPQMLNNIKQGQAAIAKLEGRVLAQEYQTAVKALVDLHRVVKDAVEAAKGDFKVHGK